VTIRRVNGAVGLLLLGALAGCEESSQPSDATEAERGAEETGVAAAALVSASFELGTYPLEPYPFPTSWDVEWECGVGHLVWVEKLADRDRVMQVRFNQAGQLLDAAPLLVYEQAPPNPPNPLPGYLSEGPRRVDGVHLERSAEGVWLAIHEVENWTLEFEPGKTNRVRGFVLSADGSVSGNTVLGVAQDTIYGSNDLYTIDIYTTGFDGTHAYVVFQVNLDQDPTNWEGDLRVVRDDGLVVRSASGWDYGQPFLFNSFACGFGHCMFRWIDAPPSPEYMFHSDIFSSSGLLQATYPPYTASDAKPVGQPVALESCDFLVAGTKSWVLEGHSIVGGPHPLPGTWGGSLVDDGVELTRYFTDTGVLSSHTFDVDGAPQAVAVSEPSLVGNRIVRMGDGKSLAVLRTGNTFTAQFVGSSALVEVDGQCDLLGDAGLASGNNPDCSQLVQVVGLGSPCTLDAECDSGFCVDGVCCNSSCAGGCEACSVATGSAIDGVCSALATNTVCRTGDVCNPEEKCDGVSGECPADVYEPDGTSCFGVCPSSCLAGQCVAPPNCDFEILCGAGQCDDGNQCTQDKCFSVSGCSHTPLTGNACNLDNPCAENGICTANGCVGTAKPAGTPCPGGTCIGLVCTPDGGSGGAGGSGAGGSAENGGSGAGGSAENGGSAEGGAAGSGGAEPTGGSGLGGDNTAASTGSGEPPQRLELSGGTGSCDVASGRTSASGLWLVAGLAGVALGRRKRKLAS
jgi:MYXO-CTERM domain-containing protein